MMVINKATKWGKINMNIHQPQIAKVIGMNQEGDLLLVQGLGGKSDYQRGGKYHGYRREWGVNHYSYTDGKECVMAAYGLTEAEYDHWNQLFVNRFDRDKDEWYVDEAVKTYKTLSETGA